MRRYEWDEKKNESNNNISGSEALTRIESGQTVDQYSINFERIKVEALDVMKLSKVGVDDIKLDTLIENLLEGFYKSHKKLSEKE